MNRKDLINVDNVSKVYGKSNAVKNVTFTIKRGEVIGLVGPNGAGKTTIMKMIVGLTRNYMGNIYFEGKDIKDKTNDNIKNIGCVIETPALYPQLTGYENLKYFAAISGCKDIKDVDEVVKALKIEGFIHKKVKKYSLGMKQLVSIAQSVLGNPKVLVLDEPTNGLDPNVVLEIRKFIKYVSKEKNMAVIISSHILSEIESMCEKVIFIKNGEVIDNISLKEQENKINNIFVFKTYTSDILLEFLKEKNIPAKKDNEDNVVANLEKYSIKEIFKMINNSSIDIEEVYKQKQTLENRFMKKMEGNRVE